MWCNLKHHGEHILESVHFFHGGAIMLMQRAYLEAQRPILDWWLELKFHTEKDIKTTTKLMLSFLVFVESMLLVTLFYKYG